MSKTAPSISPTRCSAAIAGDFAEARLDEGRHHPPPRPLQARRDGVAVAIERQHPRARIAKMTGCPEPPPKVAST